MYINIRNNHTEEKFNTPETLKRLKKKICVHSKGPHMLHSTMDQKASGKIQQHLIYYFIILILISNHINVPYTF